MAKNKTKKVKKAGQPTKYRDTFPAKVQEYITECTREEEGKEVELPTRVGFSIKLKVSRDTVDSWSKTYPKFSDALKKLDGAQKKELINRGLNGTYNSTITKLILSSNHGMCERKHIEGDMAINVIIDQ